MAHGQPVVSTPCAVEGMHLRDGHDVLVADDAAAFADAVVRLHEDEALWTTLSRNGLDNVARHFSLDAERDTGRREFSAPRGRRNAARPLSRLAPRTAARPSTGPQAARSRPAVAARRARGGR